MENPEKEFQQKIENFINCIADAVVGVNQNGNIVLVNFHAEKLFGYSHEELLGNKMEFLLPDRFKDIHSNHRLSYFNSPRIREMGQGPQLLGRNKDGKEFPVEVSLSPFKMGDEIIAISAVRSATENKRIEEERRKAQKRIEGLLNFSPDAIIAINQNGTIVLVNHQAESLFGYTRDELLGNKLEMLLPDRFKDIHTQHRYSYFKLPRIRGMGAGLELFGRKKDGSEFPVEVSLSPFETEEEMVTISAIRDITDHKQFEVALKERSYQLEVLNKELVAFNYSVSHDLRAPLRAINAYANILEEDYSNALDDEGKRLLGVVKNNAKKMGHLIDDLLVFSRLGRKELQKTRVNIKELVQNIFIELGRTIPNHAKIKIENLFPSYADFNLLSQVFINLISNAIKYSSKNEYPIITLKSETIDNEVIYSISDNGVGFDMQYIDKLFGVFQRLHSDEEFEGTGVGLAIVQRIINKHGGRVWAEGKTGKGATFYFSLPKVEDEQLTVIS